MATKKDVPPPRPPAPKVKQKSKAASAISIRFNPTDDDSEDDDLTLFGGSSEKKKESVSFITTKTNNEPSNVPKNFDVAPCVNDKKNAGTLSTLHITSKSMDDDIFTTSIPKEKLPESSNEASEEKWPTLSDIRGKITDKIAEPIAAISRKWDEISGESGSSPENETEKSIIESTLTTADDHPLLHTDPLDDETIYEMNGEFGDDDNRGDLKECNDNTNIDEAVTIVDNFFPSEPIDDYSGSITFHPRANSAPSQVRSRSKIKKLIPTRQPPVKTEPKVTLSTLLNRNVSLDSTDIFLDAQDSISNNSSGSPADSSPTKNKSLTDKIDNSPNYAVPFQKLIVLVFIIFGYLIIPLPSYLSGMIMGGVLVSLGWTLFLWLTKPAVAHPPVVLETLDKLPPLTVPEMKEPKLDDGIYKGYMNELMVYNPEHYHINQTQSVFVRLEGTSLRLSRPNTGIPKRAMRDEFIPVLQFVHQRHFDLDGSRVFLMPAGLVKKRVWSKKYPICVALSKSSNAKPERPSDTSAVEADGFDVITEQQCDTSILYLFARTCREKEEWYKRFEGASKNKPLINHILEIREALRWKRQQRHSSSNAETMKHRRQGSTDSTSSLSSLTDETTPEVETRGMVEFARYMSRLMPSSGASKLPSPTHSRKDSKEAKDMKSITGAMVCDQQLLWLNALIGRSFWDFLGDKYWANKVKEKLQKKLSKIHVPFFIEELQITDIDLGTEMPVIRKSSKPFLDERGFWVDLDVAYSGGFRMTITTKLNLMKLMKSEKTHKNTDKKSPVTDSEEEDSAESSTDEEEENVATSPEEPNAAASGGGTGKKILKYLDKFTQSKYFQSATENKYIKKAMQGVSNTALVLTVEVKSLVGVLAVNIPPPPTDRLWYGFRDNPRLWLVAKPKVGAREVTVTHVTDWIEEKLATEFQRVFVLPNMDDLLIPILLPGAESDAVPTPPCSQYDSEV